MNEPAPEDVVYSCGCTVAFRVVQGERVCIVTGCEHKSWCRNYATVQGLIADSGKPIEYRTL